ncbi:MAG: Spy/CpxP family protein refolding chaperone [Deltaproteobacteria bacterium]
MTKRIRMGLAMGAAILLGLISMGAQSWAQENIRFGSARAQAGFQFRDGRGFGHGGPMMGGRLLAMLDSARVKTALGLTDDQSNRLRQIVIDTEKNTIKTRADMAVRQIELRELMRADNPDRDAVMKKLDEVSALRSQMMKQHVEALLSAKSVLTPEQQKKIRTFIENRRAEGFMRGSGSGWQGARRGRFGGPAGSAGPGRPPAPGAPDAAPQQQ